MLNTKYVIYNPEAPPLENRKALGNAWFVSDPLFAENANEEISLINSIDPAKQAVIDRKFQDQVNRNTYPQSEGDKIGLKTYEPNELVYTSNSVNENLAVFSEIYYPAGWKSFIDGNETPHFRVNYVLRGLIIPAGDHEIKFRFEPASYTIGNRISYASSAIFILLILGYLFIVMRSKSKPE
ncbi:MAG TPA: hypothetical protein DD745_07820 [Bacteroidales bacterium]|nr:hypothetical protein [Bacteroidales bacterium]